MESLEVRATPAVLVAAYAFDEGAGITAADLSGNENTGTLVGGATWTAAGKYGNALSFNGTDALVNVADSDSLDLTAGMTLEAWVKPSTISPVFRDVIYKGADDDVYFLDATSTNNGRPAGGMANSPPFLEVYGTAPLVADTWAHLALTYDLVNLRLYVNGTPVATTPGTDAIVASDKLLQIGGATFYMRYFDGLIDEVRIYDGALSETEVQTDMNTPIPPDTDPPTVSIDSPVPAATVSHVVVVTANASDFAGVTSVEFFVDGDSIGTDYDAPYSGHWDSTVETNGPHDLTAVARDAAGNETTSAIVQVTTLNPVFVNEAVVPGVTSATTMAFLPDGRMLVGELINKIFVVQPGENQPDPVPFLDLGSEFIQGEQGLQDMVLDPDFQTNNYFYVFYTKGYPTLENRDRVSRFTADGNSVVPGSEVVLWEDDVDAGELHLAGGITIGNDGKLYFTAGDFFQPLLAQELDNYQGKLLRINKDGTIPLDNPFYDGAGPNKDEIWAYGLRNPYRIANDPATGRIYIGEVGGNDINTSIEEINLAIAGANYGWPLIEGDVDLPGMTPPIYSWPHAGRDAAATAGLVYHGTQFPSEYEGNFFFADFAQNTIQRLIFDGNGDVLEAVSFWPADGSTDGPSVGDPVKFVEGPDGSLYYIDIGFDGNHQPNPAFIRRIRYTTDNLPPIAVADADLTAGLPPLSVNFSSAGSFDPEGAAVTYDWDFDDTQTSTEANPTHIFTTAGQYTVRLIVSDGTSTTLAVDLIVTVGNPPVPTILMPSEGSFFRAGDTINYSGTATDIEDGPLPASAFSWSRVFHHETHTHPAGGPFTGSMSGSLVIPTTGHDFQGATSYEISLTVTDSSGIPASTSVEVYPDKVNLTFDTVPSGLTLSIDGINKVTPFVLDDIINFQHTINAPDQSSGGSFYGFVSWSDAGAQSHQIVTPESNQSYVATFQATTVVGRQIFYNQSKYDNNTSGVDPADSSAIATDKSAYLPGGGLITPSSVTGYSLGINGIMVDIAHPKGPLLLSDFTFRMSGQGSGVNNTPSTWVSAPAPSGFTVLSDMPSPGTDRVEFIWTNNAIVNRYLEVIVEGNDTGGGNNTNTGLGASDIFFFGNRIGDDLLDAPAGPTFLTNAADEIDARSNPGFLQPLTNIYDYNKDSIVNAADQIIARGNGGFQFKINIASPPAAPGAAPFSVADGSSSAVIFALAAGVFSPAAASDVTARVDVPPAKREVDSAPLRRFWQQLGEGGDPRAGVVLDSIDMVVETIDFDDWLDGATRPSKF
ncbi:MAG: PQQ-dependent sugar dehydrogenase [Pirellulales bacterium]